LGDGNANFLFFVVYKSIRSQLRVIFDDNITPRDLGEDFERTDSPTPGFRFFGVNKDFSFDGLIGWNLVWEARKDGFHESVLDSCQDCLFPFFRMFVGKESCAGFDRGAHQ